jgi:hypothetical protein
MEGLREMKKEDKRGRRQRKWVRRKYKLGVWDWIRWKVMVVGELLSPQIESIGSKLIK